MCSLYHGANNVNLPGKPSKTHRYGQSRGVIPGEIHLYQSAHPGVKEFQNRANDVFPERNIAFRTDSISSLISMVSSSDLLGFIPISIYEAYKETLKLKRIAAPFELPEIHVYMLYSRSSLNSSVFQRLLRKCINSVFPLRLRKIIYMVNIKAAN